MNIKFKKSIASFFLGVFVVAQVFLISSYLLKPKQAEAIGGVADTNIIIGNIYDVIKDIGLAALRQVAVEFANKFLTRFVSKLQDKYKIRNFLYYDQVLTDYYLNRYIADKVTDPDLRGIYALLERGFVSGAPTGTSGGPDPRRALIPRLNAAITKVYLKRGGLDPNRIKNSNNFSSDAEYFDATMAFYSNHPSFTEQNLQGEFGALQSSATTASQLEILVGNALKAGRIVGGTCRLPTTSTGIPIVGGVPGGLGGTDPNKSPTACQQAGGTWQASAVDQARSFIDNPTMFTEKWADAAIKQITGNNFDPNNYKAAIGSFIGSFIFNQLLLDRSGGTLPDSPDQYAPEGALPPDGDPIDIDGDGITDGYDINADGESDVCVYGGLPDGAGPPCKPSGEAMENEPPVITCTDRPTAQACSVPNHTELVRQVKSYLISVGIYPDPPPAVLNWCDSYEIVRRVAWELRGEGAGMIVTFHSSRCPASGISGDLIGYPDNSYVDILIGGTGPAWQSAPGGPPESGVFYVVAQDPGDPADACYKTLSCP